MHGAVVTFLQRKPVITVDSNSRHCTKLYTPEKHTGPKNKSCGSLSTGQAMQRAGSRLSSCCSSERTQETHGGRSELRFEKEDFQAAEGRVSYLHMLTKHHLELCLLLTTAKLTVLLHFYVCLQHTKVYWKKEGIFLISDTRRMGEKNKQSQGNIFTLTFLKHTWPLGACGVGDLERARTEQWIGESPFSYFKKIGALATSSFATSFQKYQTALPRGEGFVSNSASFRLWGCGPPCDRTRPRL